MKPKKNIYKIKKLKSKSRSRSRSRSKSRSRNRSRRQRSRRKKKKNFMMYNFIYNSINVMYKLDVDNKVEKITKIKISKHIPIIIRLLVNNIPYKFNNYYILCPYYSDNDDCQIGVTETVKYNENYEDAIIRGGNEELGIEIKYWHKNNVKRVNNYKNWYGTSINKNYTYNPNIYFNKNVDNNSKKVALVVFDTLDNILKIYKNYKKNDIVTDNISGIVLISVYDIKKIINNLYLYKKN